MINSVALDKCETYDFDKIKEIVKKQFENLNINRAEIENKKVVLKPNLVSKKGYDKAVSTHPIFVDAVVSYMADLGAKEIIIAESPAGLYTEGSLKSSYQASGFYESSLKLGAKFNFDTSARELKAPNAVQVKVFNIISPILDADIVINLCKLKTHSLTAMSAAAKNYFGLIPGTEKVEMHARFQNQLKFMEMLVDLAQVIQETKPMINICDGIIGMEGNGPTNGTPKQMSCILTSKNPFALDLVAATILKLDNKVEMLNIAKKRNLIPQTIQELEIIGAKVDDFEITNFIEPDSHKLSYLRKLPAFLKPRPIINTDVCVGCGRCAEACPEKTIIVKNKKAHIHKNKCIRCFCCQELCPFNAINIKQNFIFKIFH